MEPRPASGVTPGVLLNPSVRADYDGPPSPTAPLTFHRRLPGYSETPLVDADALAARLGVAYLGVKHEAERFGLPAFKMMGTVWAAYRLVVERLGHEPTAWHDFAELAEACAALRPFTLASATDGNHGRAVARIARLLGFGCHILVPAGVAPARREAIEAEGATVTVVDGTYDEAVERASYLASKECAVLSDTSWNGYEEVPRWIAEGYSTIFHEVDEQLARRGADPVDVVMVPVGVGALAAAVVRHYRRRGVTIVGVEPRGAECVYESVRVGERTYVPGPHDSIMAGLNCGMPSLVAWPVLRDGLDAVVVVDDDDARRGVRDLASIGLVVGETGAAALAGLTRLVESGAAATLGVGAPSRVLTLATEGATDLDAYDRIVGADPASA